MRESPPFPFHFNRRIFRCLGYIILENFENIFEKATIDLQNICITQQTVALCRRL